MTKLLELIGARFRLKTTLLFVCLLVSNNGFASTSFEAERQQFLMASTALSEGRLEEFNELLSSLSDYPVVAYLHYDYFRQSINNLSVSEAADFLQTHQSLPFAYHARGLLLNRLAKEKDWENFVAFFDGRDNTRLTCLHFPVVP